MINRTPGKVFEGELNAKGLRIGIVCSRFNEFFVGKLLVGAMDALSATAAMRRMWKSPGFPEVSNFRSRFPACLHAADTTP